MKNELENIKSIRETLHRELDLALNKIIEKVSDPSIMDEIDLKLKFVNELENEIKDVHVTFTLVGTHDPLIDREYIYEKVQEGNPKCLEQSEEFF